MADEITSMSKEMNTAVNAALSETTRVKPYSGNMNASFAGNICRKLAAFVEVFAGKLKGHVSEVSRYWNIVENSYLSLLDNCYTQTTENIEKLREAMRALDGMQNSISNSDVKIKGLIGVLRGNR